MNSILKEGSNCLHLDKRIGEVLEGNRSGGTSILKEGNQSLNIEELTGSRSGGVMNLKRVHDDVETHFRDSMKMLSAIENESTLSRLLFYLIYLISNYNYWYIDWKYRLQRQGLLILQKLLWRLQQN